LDGGVLVAAFGELFADADADADAVAVGVGGGAVIVAELLDLGHESFLRGLDLAEPGAERVGLAVVSFSLLGRAGRELGIKHGGAVVAEQVLVGEQGERGGDDLVFDGDPAVLGVGAVRLGQRDIDGLILCAEHSGAPYDLLAAGLRVEPARLRAITGPDRRTWLTQTLAELGHHA